MNVTMEMEIKNATNINAFLLLLIKNYYQGMSNIYKNIK
jgi:hypothetical protein